MNCWLRRLMSSLRVVRRSNSPVIGHNLQNGPAAYTTGGRRSYTAESHCAARPYRAYTLLHRAYSLAAKLRLSEYGKITVKVMMFTRRRKRVQLPPSTNLPMITSSTYIGKTHKLR